MTATYDGPNGTAVELGIDPRLPGATTVSWWLLTGPWHPAWSQFVISVVHLRHSPGTPPPKLHFPGATHELCVLALNPGDPPRQHSPLTLTAGGMRAVGGWLEPVDVVHQFTATDDEMVELASLLARALRRRGVDAVDRRRQDLLPRAVAPGVCEDPRTHARRGARPVNTPGPDIPARLTTVEMGKVGAGYRLFAEAGARYEVHLAGEAANGGIGPNICGLDRHERGEDGRPMRGFSVGGGVTGGPDYPGSHEVCTRCVALVDGRTIGGTHGDLVRGALRAVLAGAP